MNKTLTAILTIVISLGILFAGCGGQGPRVGEPAPDFQFQGSDGQPTSLSDLQGSPVLLNFWATYCPPCREEMPYLQQVYNEWQGKGLVLLLINIGDSSSDVAAFMQSEGLFFPVLLDSNGATAARYDIRSIPTTFFIDSKGVIQHIKVGAFGSAAEIESLLSQLD
jgi:thiol-disulfide isomerase/thioredoxin